jgi:6-phosphogluconate dehydrogenase
MTKQQIGVVGMAVMGKNLALNIESRGYSVALYNRTGSKTEEVVHDNPDKNLKGTYSVEEFVDSIEKPRRIVNGSSGSRNRCNHSILITTFRSRRCAN